MKVAVVYNRESQNVINIFGMPNQEKIGLKTIRRITDALKAGKHQVTALEGDMHLVERLGEFMPRVIKGELPGMVFNLSYGIQGQARYTHIPSILEMVGIPYVGSGPLAHSLALDKVVTKMILRQNGVPTPDFAVLPNASFEMPELAFPLIVKPKNEAVSFGIRIVKDEGELREAAQVIFDRFRQPVLAEQYIEGREINVGLLGNGPPEILPPAEILFGEGGPRIYTYEDKTRKSGRDVGVACPADLSDELTERAKDIAYRAFEAIGCYDCARVDMRMDESENLYVLEINSLPSMGEHGSYTHAAATAGYDYAALVNRLVEVASARYFGTPQAAQPRAARSDAVAFLTGQRDRMERRVKQWVGRASRTQDPIGIQSAVAWMSSAADRLGLHPVEDLCDERFVWTWESPAGLAGGDLLVAHVDVPLAPESQPHGFRRDPERLYGEGVGASRASLVQLEYALRALRRARRLRRLPLGVLIYADEGLACRYSADAIRKAAARAGRVLVLRPGNAGDRYIVQRRGQRAYELRVEGKPQRLGASDRPDILRWTNEKLDALAALGSRKDRIAIAASDVRTEAFPMLLPHKVRMTLLLAYLDSAAADATEARMREVLGKRGPRWSLELASDRPAMGDAKANRALARELSGIAESLEIPLKSESSVWPSAAGLVPPGTPVLCGLGPVAEHVSTPQESVMRISLVQRTLLLAQYLLERAKGRTA